MGDFVRARSDEQKAQRVEQIKRVADELFMTRPYHEINMKLIASELGWSRGSLYNYYSSKEAVFLQIYLDKEYAYASELAKQWREAHEHAAERGESSMSDAEFARIWAHVANNHRDYFTYQNILDGILERNVSFEELVDFKCKLFQGFDLIIDFVFKQVAGLGVNDARRMLIMIENTAVKINAIGDGSCPAGAASKAAGYDVSDWQFEPLLADTVEMYVSWNRAKCSQHDAQ